MPDRARDSLHDDAIFEVIPLGLARAVPDGDGAAPVPRWRQSRNVRCAPASPVHRTSWYPLSPMVPRFALVGVASFMLSGGSRTVAAPAQGTKAPSGHAAKADTMVHVSAAGQDFWIDRDEVTVGAFAKCVREGKCSYSAPSPPWNEYCNWGRPGHHPMNCIDWEQATSYCLAQGKRLPASAEWTLAAYGTDGRRYPWGNDEPTGRACWQRRDTSTTKGKGTCGGGAFPSGASPFGALDMAGSLWEWTRDADGANRVLRGGAWLNNEARDLAAPSVSTAVPSDRGSGFGFRCVASQEPGTPPRPPAVRK